MEPTDRGDDSSLTELSDAPQDTKQPQPSIQHKIESAHELLASSVADVTPETQITAHQSPPDHPTTIENDIVPEPKKVNAHIDDVYSRAEGNIGSKFDWSRITVSDAARAHIGHVYNTVHNHEASSRSRIRDQGFDFDMGTSFGVDQQLFAFESAYESREIYTLKKRPMVRIHYGYSSLYKLIRTCLADRTLATVAIVSSRGIQDIHTSEEFGGTVLSRANCTAVYGSGRVLCSHVRPCGIVERCLQAEQGIGTNPPRNYLETSDRLLTRRQPREPLPW